MYLSNRNIPETGDYMHSKLNYLVDQASRRKMDSSGWELMLKNFQYICRKVVRPEIDFPTS